LKVEKVKYKNKKNKIFSNIIMAYGMSMKKRMEMVRAGKKMPKKSPAKKSPAKKGKKVSFVTKSGKRVSFSPKK
tara:strand:- start:1407 stop:1628 length:222 start_codon:yes stop_codon:yes gene_type:complete